MHHNMLIIKYIIVDTKIGIAKCNYFSRISISGQILFYINIINNIGHFPIVGMRLALLMINSNK